MKKFTAIIITLLMALCCLPLMAGCKFTEEFNLQKDEDGNEYYVYACNGYTSKMKGELVIPSEHDGIEVREIADQGLSMTGLSKITVPKTIKKIGLAAFAYNYSLTEIEFEEGIELDEIPQGLCGYDSALKKINIPAGVKSIGYMAFFNCDNLEEVTLPDGLETIGEQSFTYSGLKQIIIPETVVDKPDGENKIFGIGYGAFHTCEDLTAVTILAQIEEIPAGAFGYCPALETLTLPETLKKIDGAAFKSNNKLAYGHAFHNNTALKDIYFKGTQAQWKLVAVENETYTEQEATFDNSAILNATMHYETAQS